MITTASNAAVFSYLQFKVFDFFRGKLFPIINQFRTDTDTPDFKHIFLSPSQVASRRVFTVRGVALPLVSLWCSSPLEYNKAFYGRSVLPVDFGPQPHKRGFLADFQCKFDFFAASYFLDFRSAINMALIEFDRIRVFDISLNEFLTNNSTRAILTLESISQEDKVDETSAKRMFTLTGSYLFQVSFPLIYNFDYIESVRVYLDEEQIWASPTITLGV